jgi:chloride channel protein, CIC family
MRSSWRFALGVVLVAFSAAGLRRESIYTAELMERGVGWEVTMEGRRLFEQRRSWS